MPILARWITDWDCGEETSWWYVIKDTPFDIGALKAKRRYEINKGKKNFDVKQICVKDYEDEIYEVTQKAYSAWPAKYRPMIDEVSFKDELKAWSKGVFMVGLIMRLEAFVHIHILQNFHNMLSLMF